MLSTRRCSRRPPLDQPGLGCHFHPGVVSDGRRRRLSPTAPLSTATRIHPAQTAAIRWPERQGIAWPHTTFDLSASFEQLKPAGLAWPKISVVTPSFNQVEYVEETLLSVLHQGYPALEYIVLDAESTDGTIDILKRYEPRLSRLVIERDEGQTDALNKGLNMSTGDILLWINPTICSAQALFAVATGLSDRSSRRHRRLLLQAQPATFRTHQSAGGQTGDVQCQVPGRHLHALAQGRTPISPRWPFASHFRTDRVASQKDSTTQWITSLAALREPARLTRHALPTGFFQARETKTTRLDDTIIEQASVRDRFVMPQPGCELKLDITRRLRRAFAYPTPEVSVVSTRASKIFSGDTGRELRENLAADGLNVAFHSDIQGLNPRAANLVIVLMHLQNEPEALHKLRENGYDGPVVGWLWDNHHHVFENYRAAAALDVCIPGHAFAASYLRSPGSLLLAPVPLCATQWTGDEARRFFQRHGLGQRSNALYGGVGRYAFAEKRKQLVEDLIFGGMRSIYLLDEHALDSYFGLSLEERFKRWAFHKVSLCLPLSGTCRSAFDALLADQIPIVPDDARDLDDAIPRRCRTSCRLSGCTDARPRR